MTGRSQQPRTLPPGEWERLLRERVYLRPIPVPPTLHVMARRRIVIAGTDGPAADIDRVSSRTRSISGIGVSVA